MAGSFRKFGSKDTTPKTDKEQKLSVGGGYVNKSEKTGEEYLRFFIGDKNYVAFFVKDKKEPTHPDFRILEDTGQKGRGK